MSYTIHTFPVTEIQQNCRLIQKGDKGVLIDPGGEGRRLLSLCEELGVRNLNIWLTHSHFDHCGAVAIIKRLKGAKLWANPLEAEFRARVSEIVTLWGMSNEEIENCPEPDYPLVGEELLSFEDSVFKVIFCPGHSPGHLCFFDSEKKILFAGDTIFADSIGRTDLPGGNTEQLMKSIREKLLVLPPETKVLPGHGPDTTIQKERHSNPYLKNAM